jgi:hypothetical protein
MKRHPYAMLVASALMLVILLLVSGVRLGLWLLGVATVVSTVVVVLSGAGRWRGASSFVVPLLIAVPWIVDKGDEDGLWVLCFPLVLGMIPLIVAGSWIVARIATPKSGSFELERGA